MKVIKIISGVVLILFSVLLFFATISATFQNIRVPESEIGSSSSEKTAYMFGTIVASCIFIAIAYFLSKFGLKLIRNQPKKVFEIDEIGQQT